MNADRVIAQEGTDESTGSDATSNREPRVESTDYADSEGVTGPHFGRDEQGRFDHRYWRCERCGFESIDPRLRRGCFRCTQRGADVAPRESIDAE